MKKLLKAILILLAACFGLGIIISIFEKEKSRLQGYMTPKSSLRGSTPHKHRAQGSRPRGHKPYGSYEKHIKRPLDFSIATLTLLIIWPILLPIAIMVRIKLGSPIIFKQQRPGMIDPRTGKERIFTLYKFRTMTDAHDSDGNLLPDEERLTWFGRLLRSTSLDELPELINIIKGDMSIVGPRPLLTKYIPRYSEEQRHRHDVRPGLTGYAQTEGRNLCSWDKKFEKDIEYVNHITFAEDIRILIKTVGIVLKREGITSETSATTEEFMGIHK